MVDIESRIRGALQTPSARPDETFVRRIETQVAAHERHRAIGLAAATLVAAALGAGLLIGLGLAGSAAFSLAEPSRLAPPPVVVIALQIAAPSVALLLLAALLSPLTRFSR